MVSNGGSNPVVSLDQHRINCEATITAKCLSGGKLPTKHGPLKMQIVRGPLKSEIKDVTTATFSAIDLTFNLKT